MTKVCLSCGGRGLIFSKVGYIKSELKEGNEALLAHFKNSINLRACTACRKNEGKSNKELFEILTAWFRVHTAISELSAVVSKPKPKAI